jgi:hypothetical protein
MKGGMLRTIPVQPDESSHAEQKEGQKRNSQSQINSSASMLVVGGGGGVTPLGSSWSSMVVALDQIVEVNKAAQQGSSQQDEQHKPPSGHPRRFGVKRIRRLKNEITQCFSDAQIRSVAQVLAQNAVNGLAAYWIAYHSKSQLCGNC